MCREEDIFRQRLLNHSGVSGGGNAFKRVYPAQAYSTLVVLVFFVIFSNEMLMFTGVLAHIEEH